MSLNTEYFTEWEDYQKENPHLADLDAKVTLIPDAEDKLYRFIFNLFL